MPKSADLHIHTNFSDGSFSPKEVMARAKEENLQCIAIADHDNVDATPLLFELQRDYDIEVVPAVEMTAQEGDRELHILGYLIDWQSKKLKEKLRQTCEGRKERIYRMTEKLNACGVKANAGEIIKFAKISAVSRLHVARYLVENGFVDSLKTVFSKYIGDGKPCYESRFRFSSKEVVEIIKESGGIAVVAHPGLDSVAELLPDLIKNGIDGIEVFHSDHNKQTTEVILNFAQKHNLLITGGSDCHGRYKREVLIGKIKLPYEYVEKLKEWKKKKDIC